MSITSADEPTSRCSRKRVPHHQMTLRISLRCTASCTTCGAPNVATSSSIHHHLSVKGSEGRRSRLKTRSLKTYLPAICRDANSAAHLPDLALCGLESSLIIWIPSMSWWRKLTSVWSLGRLPGYESSLPIIHTRHSPPSLLGVPGSGLCLYRQR
jgi:hypothetical protein